jgi:hypothetical protein
MLIRIAPDGGRHLRACSYPDRGPDAPRVEPADSVAAGAPVDSVYDAFSVRIYNDTDTDIVGLILKWEITDRLRGNAVPLSIRYNDAECPGLPARSRLVFGYGTLGSGWVDLSKPVTMTVDAVMFADGRLIGDNSFGLDRDVAMKATMLRKLSQDLLALRGREGEIPELLRPPRVRRSAGICCSLWACRHAVNLLLQAA